MNQDNNVVDRKKQNNELKDPKMLCSIEGNCNAEWRFSVVTTREPLHINLIHLIKDINCITNTQERH